MSHAGHAHGEAGAVRVARWPRIVCLAIIAASALAATLGLLAWWPDGGRVHHVEGLLSVTAPGVSEVHARLVRVQPACADGAVEGPSCGRSSARVEDGASSGRTVPVELSPDVIGTGLRPGDRVLLLSTPSAPAAGRFAFYRDDRAPPMLWLTVLFAIVVVLVARWRGLMALVSLAVAGVVLVGVVVPALLAGEPAVPVTVSACVLILIVMLYATHGPSMRTSVALVGAFTGLALAALLGWIGVVGTRLGGLGDDSAELLTFNLKTVDVQQLVIASVIVAGLGTLNDVTVTQASAIWELREASPDATRGELFGRAVRIGRDHVASSVYTLVFAYLGTALVLLVAIRLYSGTFADFVTAEDVAEDVVRSLVGAIALVLAMPVTTAIAAIVVPGPRGGPRRTIA